MTDPLHQFQIHVIAPLFRIGGVQLPFAEMSTLVIALAYIGMFVLTSAQARETT